MGWLISVRMFCALWPITMLFIRCKTLKTQQNLDETQTWSGWCPSCIFQSYHHSSFPVWRKDCDSSHAAVSVQQLHVSIYMWQIWSDLARGGAKLRADCRAPITFATGLLLCQGNIISGVQGPKSKHSNQNHWSTWKEPKPAKHLRILRCPGIIASHWVRPSIWKIFYFDWEKGSKWKKQRR